MAIWELIVDALKGAHEEGRPWLGSGEIAHAVEAIAPGTNLGSVRHNARFHCINDPSKKHSPGLRYLKDPRLITDDPTMRGKRYRLLTEAERRTFLDQPRDDLDQYSYTQVMEWLRDPSAGLAPAGGDEDADPEPGDELGGVALLELHLEDYLFRNWKQHFPHLDLFEGPRGREFITSDPGVGTIDFLCMDRDGNFVVIETKRDQPDRRAIGQILGYMGWVQARLAKGRRVSGMLVAGSGSDSLRMAIAVVPNLELWVYELSFSLHRE
ncbi:MAG: endonuclease NucS [Chloroflexi bacterium]|nr:endonuclease NucS [Chloroflexota bacterium]